MGHYKLIVFCLLVVPTLSFGQANSYKFSPLESHFQNFTANPKEGVDSSVVDDRGLAKLMEKRKEEDIKAINNNYDILLNKKKVELSSTKDLAQAERITQEINSILSEKEDKIQDTKEFYESKYKQYDFKSRTKGFVFFFRTKRRVKNAFEAQIFYEQYTSDKTYEVLGNTTVTYSSKGDKISIINELYKDYIGPFRWSFSALISNKASTDDPNESQKDAVQRLLGGGGNGLLSISYPLMGYVSSSKRFGIRSSLVSKNGLDVPALGTSNSTYAYNSDNGVDLNIYYMGIERQIALYFNGRFGNIVGNDDFYKNIGKQETPNDFSFHQAGFGVEFLNTFRLSYNVYFGSDFVTNNFPNTLSFSVIPSK